MMGRESPRGQRGDARAAAMAVSFGAVLLGTVLLGRIAGAQEPFLTYDFETGGLEDFFLPLGVDLWHIVARQPAFAACAIEYST